MTNKELVKTIKPEQIVDVYAELFPNDFEFLVLFNLYINYHSAEMQYVEIKQAIIDTSRLPFLSTGKDKQIERIFKGLLRSFIVRVPEKPNCFTLTTHTEKIIEIATQRINNPYLRFPLKDTFEEYFQLPDNAAEDINILQSWFKFGFQNIARQIVIGHLEGLKFSVNDSVKALNKILEEQGLSAIQMLQQFSDNFQTLGDKARQISEAIKMKVDVHYKLRDIVNSYISPQTSALPQEDNYLKLHQNRLAVIEIREEVYTFFEKVDKQLDLINNKMAFAASKIRELQESLRAQSHYKISLKKMLVYLLENSLYDSKEWIKLPEKFARKGMVEQKFRFRGLRYYDMGFLKRATPFEHNKDEEYEVAERVKFEDELSKQVTIQNHIEYLQQELNDNGNIDLSTRLFEIMSQDNSIEIGIQAGYELIRTLPLNNSIEIKKELQSNNNDSVHLWKTIIRDNRD